MHHVEVVTRLEGEHIEQLEGLVREATTEDGHEPIGEHKFLRLQHGDDLALAFLAYEGSQLVGYAHTLTFVDSGVRRVSCEIVVRPQSRRDGVGRTLLENVIAHALSQHAARLDVWAYNDSEAGRHLAAAFHLQPSRRLLHMHRHPGSPPTTQKLPGCTIRPFRPAEDDVEWLTLNNRIFAGHPENGNWTMEDLQARLAQPWFRAEDFLVLECADRMAGFCWLKVEEREGEGRVGEIYVIGIAPEHHGRGLGRLLLASALSHLSRRSVDAVAVYVDGSNTAGIHLYQSMGFHHHHVDVLYSLPLTAEHSHSAAAAARG